MLATKEKPHPGFQLPAAALQPGFGFAISNTATEFDASVYDFCGGPRSSGYFRDAETGNDYAKNRYHQPGMGRFMSVDPYSNSAGPSDPGSWNRYAYTRGDPINRHDPMGLDDCDPDEKTCTCDPSEDFFCDPTGGGGGGIGGGTGLLPISAGQLATLRAQQQALILAAAQAIAQALNMKRQPGRSGKNPKNPQWAEYVDITKICPDPLGGVDVTYAVISDTGQIMNGSSLQGTAISESFSYQSGNVNLNPQASVWTSPGTINNAGQFDDWVTGGTQFTGTAVQSFWGYTPFGLQPLGVLLGGTNSGGYLTGAQSLTVNFNTYGYLTGSVDGMTSFNCK